MPRFLFVVELSGLGATPEEAWADAVEQFCIDPGEPHETIEQGDDPFEGADDKEG